MFPLRSVGRQVAGHLLSLPQWSQWRNGDEVTAALARMEHGSKQPATATQQYSAATLKRDECGRMK
jgi:hypothetical protein